MTYDFNETNSSSLNLWEQISWEGNWANLIIIDHEMQVSFGFSFVSACSRFRDLKSDKKCLT